MKTSEPPPASCWAAPPEFYLDENSVTRSVRRLLVSLGYAVHTPPELFGSADAASGASDEQWLGLVQGTGWAVISRDLHIMQRPAELEAYKRAKVHMFLLPGQATSAQLQALTSENLATIVTYASSRRPGVWKILGSGLRRI